MVNQLETPTPVSSGHLQSATKSEPYLTQHTIVVHIGCALCDILWELVQVMVVMDYN